MLLKTTFAAGLGAGVLGGVGMVVSFLFPVAQKNPGRVLLGSVTSFPVGSETYFNLYEDHNGFEATTATRPGGAQLSVWLVRLEQGFLALSPKCTHLGCTVPWRADFSFPEPGTNTEKKGWFRCPCHAATYTDAGVRVYGPAPRSLDRYGVKVIGSHIYMDAAHLTKGTPDNAKFAVDPDAPV